MSIYQLQNLFQILNLFTKSLFLYFSHKIWLKKVKNGEVLFLLFDIGYPIVSGQLWLIMKAPSPTPVLQVVVYRAHGYARLYYSYGGQPALHKVFRKENGHWIKRNRHLTHVCAGLHIEMYAKDKSTQI